MKNPRIEVKGPEDWQNWHRTRYVGGRVEKVLKPFNQYEDGSTVPGREFEPGLAGLQSIVEQSAGENQRVRAFGSRWSLNDIAFSKSNVVNCEELTYCKVGIEDRAQLAAPYQAKGGLLAFVQCGVFVKELNRQLLEKNLALMTSGASDGQRLVGAVSTGTHGSAHGFGSMQEFVRGIHLVTLDQEHVFLQRKSDPAVTGNFAAWLGSTRLVEDDDLFNAALVAFGSFGFVHGLLIETEPNYLLKRVIKNYDFDQVVKAITTLDMKGLDLPEGDTLPFHFEVVLNPYQLGAGQKGAYVRAYYKLAAENAPVSPANAGAANEDIHTNMGLHFDQKSFETELKKRVKSIFDIDWVTIRREVLGVLLRGVLNKEFPAGETTNYPSVLFSSESSTNPTSPAPLAGTSIEIGTPLSRVGETLKVVIEAANREPFGAPLAFRFVKQSGAMLPFTHFAPISVAMEMPGLDDPFNWARNGHAEIFQALESSGIPHSYHWGQQFPPDARWVTESFGADTVKTWKALRLKLLGETGIKIFSSDLLDKIGLSS